MFTTYLLASSRLWNDKTSSLSSFTASFIILKSTASYEKVWVTNNAIAVHFRYFPKGGVKTGRVLLPWSESAQWFGVDVAYDWLIF